MLTSLRGTSLRGLRGWFCLVRPSLRAPATLAGAAGAERSGRHAALAQVGTLCDYVRMAKTVIVKLTDDIDGGDADETVHFALDGRSYEIDVSTANVERLRGALKPYIEKARDRSGQSGSSAARAVAIHFCREVAVLAIQGEEKSRFRVWANMATARRISDARVRSWIAAGRP